MRRVVWLLVLAATVAVAGEGITLGEYRGRREALRKEIKGGVILLVGAREGDHGDIRTGFFQEPNFRYLTGWVEPGAVLVITPGEEMLFIPRRDPEQEKWTGPKADPADDGIREITGFDFVEPSETFESRLPELIGSAADVYTLTGQPYAERLRALLPLRELKDAGSAIARLRMMKSKAELALMRRSVEATIAAHRAAWKRMKPGLFEYQIAATMMEVYRDAGCERDAYAPIVGSGPNSTVLHYSSNRRRFDAGEVVLMDVGAECSGYAADITRTVPAGGRFTERQREIYKIVLGAQKAVIGAVKPGMTLNRNGPNSLYQIAYDYIDSHGADSEGHSLGRYFTHGIGHHIGLDVHDANDPARPLAAGMVITVEPGIYIPEESIGIRIEDMVLVTEDGGEVLSSALPKEPKQIERAVRKGS